MAPASAALSRCIPGLSLAGGGTAAPPPFPGTPLPPLPPWYRRYRSLARLYAKK